MEPLDYLRTLRRRWPVVVGAPLIALAVAVGLTASQMPTDQPTLPAGTRFEARHTLYAGYATGVLPVPLETMAFLAVRGEVPEAVAERLGSDEAGAAVAAKVTIVADAKLGTLTITTTQDSPDVAEDLVNTYAATLLDHFSVQAEDRRTAQIDAVGRLMEQQQQRVRELDAELAGLPEESAQAGLVRAERDAAIRQYGGTVERFQQLNAEGEASIGLVTLEEGTAVPIAAEGFVAPTTAGPQRVIAAMMGLLLGIALAFVIDRVDTRIRTRRGAEQAFGLPVISEVPKMRRRDRSARAIVTLTSPASVAAEAYRALRLGLQLMPRWVLSAGPEEEDGTRGRREVKGSARVILVTSAGAGEGKSTTVANLAASFAEGGKVVLVLDCDFRNPQMHNYLKAVDGDGVASYLTQEGARGTLQGLAVPTATPGVWLVPAGRSSGQGVGTLAPDSSLLEDARALADIVLVDAGPLLAVSEGATLAPKVDAVVVVGRTGTTTGDAARRATELLARLQAHVLGVVLVGMPRAELGGGYRYYSRGSLPSATARKQWTTQSSDGVQLRGE
jgi:capsular exopolysaccharide synthesis family protein